MNRWGGIKTVASLKGKAMVKKSKKPIQEKEKADGWTSTAKPFTEEDQNDGQQKCSRCGKIGEVIFSCPVSEACNK